ncbi:MULTISPECIES: NeuD/PglB/VioB family sugar acetyltransferase [unclassified Pseudomonas]|uniref:NeuD/PglB/VioB family sugar acetyltransferase n=1 Tax=Pseudomonas sp. PDM27 TaxID=2854769 RepID=UPI000C9B95DB|nr:NeuD/PglB/VioB family sugar acetyltransferase [Pseudomonas sp. PDM27]PNB74781.1 transferase [Pseudomonas sp. GW456-E7]
MKVYLLGAANPETIRMIQAVQRSVPNQEFAFLDNDPAKQGTLFYGIPVVGGLDRVAELKGDDVRFVNLITGSTTTRYQTTCQIVEAGGQLGNFLHPAIDLTMTRMGVGNYLQEGVILQAEVSIGDNSSIHMGALIAHESHVGNSVFIAHGVSVSGCCEIGDGTFIGTNASILPRTRIGRWATIGAGAVVTKDVPDYAVVVGNPGKVIKTNPDSFQDGRVFK